MGINYVVVVVKSLSGVWLFCNPMDCSPPVSSVHGTSQAGILEWVAISFPRGSSNPGIELASTTLSGGSFTTDPPGKPQGINYGGIYNEEISY